MNDVLQHVSPSAVAAAIEKNLLGYYKQLSGTKQAVWHEDSECAQLVMNPGTDFYRSIILRAQFDSTRVNARIERLLRYVQRVHMWYIGPSSYPADLGKQLEAHGLRYVEASFGLAVDMHTLHEQVELPAKVTVERDRPAEGSVPSLTRAMWVHAFSAIEQVAERAAGGKAALQSLPENGTGICWERYVACIGEWPVARATLCFSGGVVGIYEVSVDEERPERSADGWQLVPIDPEEQRQIRKAMVLVPLRAARERGYRVAVAEGKQGDVPFYYGLGFRAYWTFPIYAFHDIRTC